MTPSDRAGLRRFATRLMAPFQHGPRLVFISAVLVIGATWLSIGLHVEEQRRAIFVAAELELRGGILTLSSHAQRTVEAVNTTLRAVDSWLFEASKNTRPAPLGELSMVIADIQAQTEDPIAIRPITNDGFLFRFGAGDDFRAFVGDRPYFNALYNAPAGTLHIDEPVVSRDSGRYVLPIAMKVRDNRYGVGYLVAAVTLQQFETAYRDLLISARGRIGLVRDDGTLLVSVPGDLLEDRQAADAFVAPMLAHESATPEMHNLPSPFKGGGVMAAVLRLEKPSILVYAAFELDELQDRWLAGAWPHVGAGIVITLLTTLIAGWLRHLMRLKDVEASNAVAALAEANAANAAKRQFLANMSHELRTPLNAILGFSEVISRAMFGPIDSHYRTYGGDIHKSGKHLLHLVDQLLDISRIESGAVTQQIQPCDVNEILHEALKITESHRAMRHLDVSVSLPEESASLLADRGIMRQILINLLSNASKYNREGGAISIAGKRTEDSLTLIIEDTGLGIAAKDLPLIFEPFKKGDAHVALSTEAGFGLGLPIVKALVELMGGKIDIVSTAGIGTRVTVSLPHAVGDVRDVG